MDNEQKYLRKVYLASDVYAVCLQHALSNAKEEIMGLLIGEVDEAKYISHISACVILHRSDKQPDRVEISPEQLSLATTYCEKLQQKLNRPMRVIGWYHSHPHITVWPSHVDVQTQYMYQLMDPLFVGIIFSVYQNDTGATGNHVQLTCFQAMDKGSDKQRREVEVIVKHSPLQLYNLEGITGLPRILLQEEVLSHEEEKSDIEDPLATLHNDAFKTLAYVHIVSKIAMPLCDDLEARLRTTNQRIQELERLKIKQLRD